MGASDQPKYEIIAADLRQGIESGKYPVGSRLPTKAELKASYGVAQNTVDHAIDILRQAGLVESKQGLATFVIRTPAESEAEKDAVRMLAAKLDLALERLGRLEERQDETDAMLRQQPQ